ncbi:triose-phosphate isomerase [Candidatus Wolfebacteria bacterium]|nr:MAG: triose-phosphate isomerase [Candidatus Wolfebacteria bacterium]
MIDSNKKLIVGNWKMNPESAREAKQIFSAIKKTGSKLRNVQTVVCPPSLYIDTLQQLVGGHRVVVGAQNMFWEEKGPFTGEISPLMLSKNNVSYVILGHSERRALGETNEIVNKKVKAVFKHNITPILCVGETVRDENSLYLNFVKEELKESLAGIPKSAIKKVVIAYEPIWAIGKDATRGANPEESLEMILFIKKTLSDLYGASAIEGMMMLYGGSVSPANAKMFLREGGVDGLLVGRASLDGKTFSDILNGANEL